ncbi:MAG: hypothetical protein ACRELW_21450, partial [Candidatus Rokuibacteriota bacterium]
PELAAELARLNVDVIAPFSIRAARQATTTIPIVMALGTLPRSRVSRGREATSPVSPPWRPSSRAGRSSY